MKLTLAIFQFGEIAYLKVLKRLLKILPKRILSLHGNCFGFRLNGIHTRNLIEGISHFELNSHALVVKLLLF